MGVTYVLLLSSLGLAVTVQAQDCFRPVPGPNMSLKDEYIVLEIFPDGTQVSFTCNVGYMTAGGSSSITCTAGSWSPVRLNCERKNCGATDEITNGQVDYPDGTQFGDKAVFSCDAGYTLVGKKEITCGDRGWMGRVPVCEVVTCSPPPAFVNGTFSPNKEVYEYRDVVQYSCNKDHTLIGSKSITCSEDGNFNPDPPTCKKVECKDPQIVNGYWYGGSRPPHRPSSAVTFKCNSGYIMKGADTQTCEKSGEWSPGLPTCELKMIPTKTTTTTTTTTTASTPTGGENKLVPIVAAVVVLLLLILVGVLVFIWKRKRSPRTSSDKEATKDETERVALS